MPPGAAYWAFISYSHRDEEGARALHRALETYRVPRVYVGTDTSAGRVPGRLYPCFRDRDELAGASSLGATIEGALAQSGALIVICSPSAATSKWVNAEIRYFRKLGRGERIFAYLVEGEPESAFPPALSEDPAHHEPLAADARASGDGPRAALLKLVAAITGIRYADLTQRDAVRRRQNRNRNAAIACSVVALVLGLYLLLADAGAPLPLGVATRTALDHYGLSVLRPVPRDPALAAAADRLKGRLEDDNFAYISHKWQSDFAANSQHALDVFSLAEYVAAGLQDPATTPARARTYLTFLDAAFAPGVFHRSSTGQAYGWYGWSDPAPWPEPALWLEVAIADALAAPGLIAPPARAQFVERLRLAQSAADTFGPHGGHWDALPHEANPNDYDTYAASIALLGVMTARRAGLGWDDSAARRDAIGRATAAWFVQTWQPAAIPLPRWNPDREDLGVTDYAGLTLQIYGELLEAQELGYVKLPNAMLAAIEQRLILLDSTPLQGDEAKVDFRMHFTNERGQDQFSARDITFALLPGAFDCAARYLRHLEAANAPPERIATLRRIAGRLLTTARNLENDKSFDRFAPVDAAYFLPAFDELSGK